MGGPVTLLDPCISATIPYIVAEQGNAMGVSTFKNLE